MVEEDSDEDVTAEDVEEDHEDLRCRGTFMMGGGSGANLIPLLLSSLGHKKRYPSSVIQHNLPRTTVQINSSCMTNLSGMQG